jgi:hypothetical protein
MTCQVSRGAFKSGGPGMIEGIGGSIKYQISKPSSVERRAFIAA